MNTDVAAEAKKLSSDSLIVLYEIDAVSLGGGVYRFCSSIDSSFTITSMSYTGITATITTQRPHLMSTGDYVRIVDATDYRFNGDFTVTVVSSTVFTYTMLGVPTSTDLGTFVEGYRLSNTWSFGGNKYLPIEVEVTGFEWDGSNTSSLPTPILKISNKTKYLAAAINVLNNLQGAKFTRIRTFRKFLDDGSSPNSSRILPKDIFYINKKNAHNKQYIEFELMSSMDQEGVKLPQMRCNKDTCVHRYRVWNGSSFDYSTATCTYTGTSYFSTDAKKVLNPAEDKCGKHLSDCLLRFGTNSLPFRGTPGIGRR